MNDSNYVDAVLNKSNYVDAMLNESNYVDAIKPVLASFPLAIVSSKKQHNQR